jgi:hypothetical protein
VTYEKSTPGSQSCVTDQAWSLILY